MGSSAFCVREQPYLVFLKGGMDATKYMELLDDVLVPFLQETYKTMCRFHQSNASSHTANFTQDYFMESFPMVMDWTPKCSDLNPMKICGES